MTQAFKPRSPARYERRHKTHAAAHAATAQRHELKIAVEKFWLRCFYSDHQGAFLALKAAEEKLGQSDPNIIWRKAGITQGLDGVRSIKRLLQEAAEIGYSTSVKEDTKNLSDRMKLMMRASDYTGISPRRGMEILHDYFKPAPENQKLVHSSLASFSPSP